VSEPTGMKLLRYASSSRSGRFASPPEKRLSARELEVVERLGQGCTTRQIAENLRVSVKTVESHYANLKRKLGLKNAPELVRFSVQWTRKHSIRTAG